MFIDNLKNKGHISIRNPIGRAKNFTHDKKGKTVFPQYHSFSIKVKANIPPSELPVGMTCAKRTDKEDISS